MNASEVLGGVPSLGMRTMRSIGPGQHEFVNGDARESAGVCKRRVGVKEIDPNGGPDRF